MAVTIEEALVFDEAVVAVTAAASAVVEEMEPAALAALSAYDVPHISQALVAVAGLLKVQMLHAQAPWGVEVVAAPAAAAAAAAEAEEEEGRMK